MHALTSSPRRSFCSVAHSCIEWSPRLFPLPLCHAHGARLLPSFRVMAVARGKSADSLVFCGLVGIMDPPRPSAVAFADRMQVCLWCGSSRLCTFLLSLSLFLRLPTTVCSGCLFGGRVESYPSSFQVRRACEAITELLV